MPSLKPRLNAAGDLRWQVRFRLNGTYSSRTFDTELEAAEFMQLCDDLGDTPRHSRASNSATGLPDPYKRVAATNGDKSSMGPVSRPGLTNRVGTAYPLQTTMPTSNGYALR